MGLPSIAALLPTVTGTGAVKHIPHIGEMDATRTIIPVHMRETDRRRRLPMFILSLMAKPIPGVDAARRRVRVLQATGHPCGKSMAAEARHRSKPA